MNLVPKAEIANFYEVAALDKRTGIHSMPQLCIPYVG